MGLFVNLRYTQYREKGSDLGVVLEILGFQYDLNLELGIYQIW